MRRIRENFSPMRHVPKYSWALLRTLQSPSLIFFALFGNAILLSAIFSFYQVEKGINPNLNSFFDALWWGVATVTTVGYGDIVPVTATGRVIGLLLIIVGVVLFISFTALLVSLFSSRIEDKVEGLTLVEYYALMDELKTLKSELQELKEEVKKPDAITVIETPPDQAEEG